MTIVQVVARMLTAPVCTPQPVAWQHTHVAAGAKTTVGEALGIMFVTLQQTLVFLKHNMC